MIARDKLLLRGLFLTTLLAGVVGEADEKGLEAESDAILKSETEIREGLLSGYDKTTMPAMNTKVTITEISIVDMKMREADQVMQLEARLTMLWDDPRLVWELNKHMDVGFLGIDPESIWTPDLAVFNGESQHHMPRSSMPTVVYPDNGTILYRSPYNLDFACVMDLTYWPHDSHQCQVKLGTWVHKGHRVNLSLDSEIQVDIPIGLTYNGRKVSAAEWDIVATSVRREEAHYPCCREPLITLPMTVVVTRNAPMYAWTVKVPVGCLSILTVILFLLPTTASEKIVFGGLCLIANLFYIAYVSSVIAHAPAHTPLIIKMMSQQILVSTLALIVSAVVLKVSRGSHAKGLPQYVRSGLIILSYPLCLRNRGNILSYRSHSFGFNEKSDELDLDDGPITEEERRSHSCQTGKEWMFLAALIDRLALFVCLAICIVSLIRYNYVL